MNYAGLAAGVVGRLERTANNLYKENTMRRHLLTVLFAASIGTLAACQPNEPAKPAAGTSPAASASPSPAAAAASPASPAPDAKSAGPPSAKLSALEGQWQGPEGTSLAIARDGEKYKVTIKNLDGKTESFEGAAKDDTIQFKRGDKLETIKAATGEETGMKYLLNEKNCVVVNKGSEGYCKKS